MLDRLAEFFLLHPNRLVAVGRVICSIASALVMLGAYANVYSGAVGVINSLGHQVRSQSTLAELLPSWPTWWIPETLIGFVFVIVVAIVGALIARGGHTIERFLST